MCVSPVDRQKLGILASAYTGRVKRHSLILAAVVACLAGMVSYVAGLLWPSELLQDIGAWLTLPLTIASGASAVAYAVTAFVAALRRPGRRPR